jgi:hypothetical protein
MYKAGTLLEPDISKMPNAKHLLSQVSVPYAVPHIYSGRVILTIGCTASALMAPLSPRHAGAEPSPNEYRPGEIA